MAPLNFPDFKLIALSALFALLFLSGAVRLPAQGADGALEAQLAGGFEKYLEALPDIPAAGETLVFLRKYPGIRFKVDWAAQEDEAMAEWNKAGQEILVSSVAFGEYGVTAGSRTLSQGQLKDFLFYYAPVFAHELSHARVDKALPFELPGNLEDEVLGWAYGSLLLAADGRTLDAAVLEGGKIWLDEFLPASEAVNNLVARLEEDHKNTEKLKAAGSEAEYAAAYAGYKLLYGEYALARKKADAIEERLAALFRGYKEEYRQQIGLLTAFRRGFRPFEEAVKIIYPFKPRLLSTPAETKLILADFRRRKKAMDGACPLLRGLPEDYRQCSSTRASLQRTIRFWSDPVRLAAARKYFKRSFAELGSGLAF